MKLNNKYTFILLSLIILLAIFLRFYKLNSIPPSLSWDEAAVGYNAYSISHFGKDEWGEILPITFHSFGDDKHPIHIYTTAIFVGIFGLSEFSVRFPAALFGVFNVILLFFLGSLLFKNKFVGLIAAFFLAISPYSIQFSRFNHELNFVLFFFLAGLLLFLKSIGKKNYLLILSFVSFGLCLLSYHSAKVVVPPFIGVLIVIYFKDLLKNKFNLIIAALVLLIFAFFIFTNPTLLGLARFNQTSFNKADFEKTAIYKKTHNDVLARAEITYNQYLKHFSWKYLFESGDNNRRHSTNVVGELYKIDLVFFVIGLIALIKLRSKTTIILFTWLLLAPLPSAFVQDSPHAARALFMLGNLQLICAWGFYTLISIGRNNILKIVVALLLISILLYEFYFYINYYFIEYSKKYAIDWQYGMKEVVENTKSDEYSQVFVTDERIQPYIFYLFYLKTNPNNFTSNVLYNQSISRSYNLVEQFEKYNFGNWDTISSMPTPGVAYVLTASEYSGLRERLSFDIKKTIYFPDGGAAFYIVSAKK